MAASTSANVLIYAEDWVTKLQESLDEPTKWKNFCEVVFSDARLINNPYHTDPAAQTYARGTPYSFQQIVETNETLTVSRDQIIAQHIDRADLAQTPYAKQM